MRKELQSLKIGNRESQYPIIQGGMSVGLTRAELAGAVANEGGIGIIGGIGLGISPEIRGQAAYFKANELALKNEIQKALEISNNGNIGVNLMVAATDYENLVETAVKSRVKFIVSGAGLPLNLPDLVKKYSSIGQEEIGLVPIISSVRAAGIVCKKWGRQGVLPVAFIVETPNTAGGHLGVSGKDVDKIGSDEYSLERVIPELVEYLKSEGLNIPVIAAGGIWDRIDIDQMLAIGASGVQVGTRFLATEECGATREFKERHINNKDQIVIIKSPVGLPGRAIENKFIIKFDSNERVDLGACVKCLLGCEHSKSGTEYCIIRALDNVRRGDIENGVLFTGTNGFKLKETGIVPAKKIMAELIGRN